MSTQATRIEALESAVRILSADVHSLMLGIQTLTALREPEAAPTGKASQPKAEVSALDKATSYLPSYEKASGRKLTADERAAYVAAWVKADAAGLGFNKCRTAARQATR